MQQLADFLTAGYPGPGRVDALEKIGRFGPVAFDEVKPVGTFSAGAERTEALATVHGTGFGGQFGVAFAFQGQVDPQIEREQIAFIHFIKSFPAAVKPPRGVEKLAAGLPHTGLFQLFRVGAGLAGQVVGLHAEDGGGGVVAVRIVFFIVEKAVDHHVGLGLADGPDHVGKHFILVPDAHGFFRVFGKTEVVGAGKTLLAAIDGTGHKQLFRTQNAEQFADLRADEVLSAVAPRERQVGHVEQLFIGTVADETLIFIIRVGCHVEHRTQHVQFLDGLVQLGGVRFGGFLGECQDGEET